MYDPKNPGDGDGKTFYIALGIISIIVAVCIAGHFLFRRYTLVYKVLDGGWKIGAIMVIVPCVVLFALSAFWLVCVYAPTILKKKIIR